MFDIVLVTLTEPAAYNAKYLAEIMEIAVNAWKINMYTVASQSWNCISVMAEIEIWLWKLHFRAFFNLDKHHE